MGEEVVRQFPFVDAVVSGDGDRIFASLITCVLQQQPIDHLPGVYTQTNVELVGLNGTYPNAPFVFQMDDLPFVHYDDYFQQLESRQFETAHPIRLLFETSRGCWWGAKHHCTFCGLNASTMAYRSKSASRALDELLQLHEMYPQHAVSVVDNILDWQYFKDFLPAIRDRQLDLDLFYEVKAILKGNKYALT